jgi:hypothetical protein
VQKCPFKFYSVEDVDAAKPIERDLLMGTRRLEEQTQNHNNPRKTPTFASMPLSAICPRSVMSWPPTWKVRDDIHGPGPGELHRSKRTA